MNKPISVATPQEFELLSQADVASVTGNSEVTIARWRREGKGPAFLKLGRKVMYRKVDVQEWIDRQRATSVAEYRRRKAA